jgi:hypothetical protein
MSGGHVAAEPPAIAATWAVAGLVLMTFLVIGAMVIERIRRKPSPGQPPGPSTD